MTTIPPPPAASPDRYAHLRHPAAGDTMLFLVRHGRTNGNLRNVLQGRSDVPLDGLGQRQAALIADRLAQERPLDAVVTSPLERALATARVIGARVDRPPVVAAGLREMDFGDYEGATFERVIAEQPELAERFLNLDDYDVAWPNGESRRGFYDRVWQAFHAILHEFGSHRVVVVAHGGVIGAFVALIQGRSPNDLSCYDLKNCSLTHLRVTEDHTVVYVRNDVCHLESLIEHGDE